MFMLFICPPTLVYIYAKSIYSSEHFWWFKDWLMSTNLYTQGISFIRLFFVSQLLLRPTSTHIFGAFLNIYIKIEKFLIVFDLPISPKKTCKRKKLKVYGSFNYTTSRIWPLDIDDNSEKVDFLVLLEWNFVVVVICNFVVTI